MGKKHTEEQRRALLDLVTSKSTTIRDAAICVGVSYSSATRWVHQSRTEGLSKRPSKALVTKAPTAAVHKPAFAQLVREVDVAS
jgi:transposase